MLVINFFYRTYQIKIVHFDCSHSFLNNLIGKCFSKYMVNFWTKYLLTPISNTFKTNMKDRLV